MWLLYSTLGDANDDENALHVSDLPQNDILHWEDVRRRAGGLIRKGEPCFAWNGSDWACIKDDSHPVGPFLNDDILRVRLVPMDGLRLPISARAPRELKPETTQAKKSAGNLTSSSSSFATIVPPFDTKSTEKVLADVADTAKKVSSLMGAKFSSWAKAATDTVKEVAATEKKFELIGGMKLRVGKKIAEGGFSEVYIAKGEDNESYALKKCRAQTSEQLSQFKREIAAHGAVADAEFVLRLLASDIGPSEGRGSIVRFVFPLCEGGSWYDAFQKHSSEEEALRILAGAARGLQALHAKSILHRDVKPHNVLLTGEGHPLLMDLGSSCPLPIQIGTKSAAALLAEEAAEQCSAPYRAPEFWEPKVGKNIVGEADIWSLGCSLYAVTFGKGYSPYEDAVQGVLKLAILNGSPVKFPSSAPYSDFCKGLIMRTVSPPGNRLSLEELIKEIDKRLSQGQ